MRSTAALARIWHAARALKSQSGPRAFDYRLVYDDMDPAFGPAYERAAPFTMTSRERMYSLWQALHYIVAAEIPGDVVECGVWRGGSAMLAALALRNAGESRRLWLYDTYKGMTPPSCRDRQFSGESANDKLATQPRMPGARNDWAFATLEDVRAQMASIAHDDVRFIQGAVEETIPAERPDAIALLRLDTDWYDSTLHELKHLWPILSRGGVLIIDDYGHWQGAREAVDEYFANQGIPLLLHRVDYTGRVAVK